MLLNNRELASLIWLAVAAAWILSNRNPRSATVEILKNLARPVLLVPLLLMMGWVALEIWVGSKLTLWNIGLVSNTVVWTLGTAMVLFFNINKAADDPRFFRKTAMGTLKASVLVTFFINLFVFSLLVELILQPVLTILVMLEVISGRKPEFQMGKKVVDVLLTGVGVVLLGYTVGELYGQWAQLDPRALILQFSLPVWLTIGILPFIYILSLVLVYEGVLRGVNRATSDRRARWRTRFVVALDFGLHRKELRSFTWMWIKRVSESPDVAGARAVVQQFRDEQRATEQAKRNAEERLRRYAGSNDVDKDGSRLDRREFRETTIALRFLATCQMGWYRNRGKRYHREQLLSAIGDDFSRHGLPKEHGIAVRVAKDGQAWYAWRRTVTGWCFAIGAAASPPDQWEFDGPEPPKGYPGKSSDWGSGPFSDDVNRNWHSSAENSHPD